jgi:hypothetical protein
MPEQLIGDVIICAYCMKPIIKGPAFYHFYDKINCRYVHYKLPTKGDLIVCGTAGHSRDIKILNKPFELIEREVENLPEEEKPSCATMYMLLEAKKGGGFVILNPVKNIEELYRLSSD